MRNRVSPSSERCIRRKIAILAAAAISIILILAAVFLYRAGEGYLLILDARTGEIFAKEPVRVGDGFSIGFVHSVNKSPLTDYNARGITRCTEHNET